MIDGTRLNPGGRREHINASTSPFVLRVDAMTYVIKIMIHSAPNEFLDSSTCDVIALLLVCGAGIGLHHVNNSQNNT